MDSFQETNRLCARAHTESSGGGGGEEGLADSPS